MASTRPKLGDALWLLYAYCLMAGTQETRTSVEIARWLRTTPRTIAIWRDTLIRAGAITVEAASEKSRPSGKALIHVDQDFMMPVKPRTGWTTGVGRWPSVAPDVVAAIDKEFLKKCGIKE